MVTAESVLTGQQALEFLIPVGFEIERTTDKIYVRRGAMKLTLPKGDEICNAHLDHIVRGIVEDLTEKAQQAGSIRKTYGLPLMMSYRSVVYGVAEDRGTKWQLKDLDDGHLFEIVKTQCEEYFPEPMPRLPTPEPIPTPVPVPGPIFTPMTNPSDKAAMYRQVRRYIEGLKVEYEQLEGKARLIREQMEPAINFMRSLHIDVSDFEIANLPPIEGKRTILPPSDAPNKKGRQTSDYVKQLKERLKIAFINSHMDTSYSYLGRLKDEVTKTGFQITVADSSLYKIMKEIKEEVNA